MEIVIGVAAKVAEYTVAPIARPLINLCKYKSNLENLKKEVEKLKAKKDTVECLIKVGEEPLPDVKLWLDKVNSIIVDVSVLVSEDMSSVDENMQCSKGFTCPQLKKSYQSRNNVPRKLKDVAQLLQEVSDFKKISQPTIPEETWLQSSEGYKAFVPRASILKNIIDALSKPDVDVVGIYGMGGIGKTTLAKQVAREAIQDTVFNKIVFVEVSKTPDIKKVQGEIGSKLGLEFSEETESFGRARRLYQQLKNEEKTLLILDNIWESLNFEKVGIPFKNDRKGLKLLLTARKNNILADGMNSLHNFHIEALNNEDAWSLFKHTAGMCVDRPDLHLVAVDVAKKCGGVPIAIVTIAKALSNKAIYEWRKVLWELRNPSSVSFDGIAADVYLSIQLSYNYLETQELKDTFLLCSSMGSNYDASIEDLLRYGIGLGIFNRCNTMEEERDNVCSLVSRLKASSLLVDAPKGSDFLIDDDWFAMHDVVCDVARSIASRDKYVFNVNDDIIPRSWETGNTLRNCTSITLHEIGKLSEDLQLVCPQLKFLYMKSKNSYSRIPDKFFAWMPILQVLHLIEVYLQPLPTSLSGLVNLQTLCLERCELKREIAAIGDLENLEILSFRHSNVVKLPEKMCQLTKLRLLDLTNCSRLTVIPPNVMSSFKKLEALYMIHAAIKWEVEKSNNERRNASLDELEHLSNLTALEIEVPDVAMSRGLLSPKLERYNIIIGERSRSIPMEIHWNIGVKTSRCLEVKLNTSEHKVISQLKGIRQLVLNEVSGVVNTLDDLDTKGFPELEYLTVKNNSHILHIVDTKSGDNIFSILESLILWNLIDLKKICDGPLGVESNFRQLRTIRVGKCNKLIDIFSFDVDRIFRELEEFEVYDCENMEKIFAIGEQVHEIKFNKLRILKLRFLPRLQSLSCNVKISSPVLQVTSETKAREIISEERKPLFNDKVAFPKLEILNIENINVETIWGNQLSTMSFVQTLTCLIISNLSKLRRLWPKNSIIEFSSLKEMRISSCPKLEFIFDNKVGVTSLERMLVSRMDNLKKIYNGPLEVESFCQLRTITVEKCNKLVDIFSFETNIVFEKLENFEVCDCENMEEILAIGEHVHEIKFNRLCILILETLPRLKSFGCKPQPLFNDKIVFQKLEILKIKEVNVEMIWDNQFIQDSFFKLKSMEVKKCQKLLTMFPLSMCGVISSLESLNVEECESLEEIFDLQGVNFEERHSITATKVGECQSLSFANLRYLNVSKCQSLKNLFSALIIVKEGVVAAEMPATAQFIFWKLTSLELHILPELKSFYPSRHTMEWPVLNKLIMYQCGIHDTKERLMSRRLFTSKREIIEGFNFKTSYGLRVHVQGIWPNLHQTMCSWVQNLTKLTVYDCGNLKELFPSSLVELKEKEIINTISFPKLSYLMMDHLENLTRLCSGYYIEFPSLIEFKISNCPELKACIFDDKLGVASLEEIKVGEMDNLKMIWHNQLSEDSFPKLKSLEVQKCQELLTVFPSNMYRSISSLEYLIVKECKSLIEIFDLQGINSKERPSIGETQTGEFCSDDPQITLSFANLRYLKVRECQSLKNLFSASIVAKDGVGATEASATAMFVFPKLTSLVLYKLPDFRTLYPGKYTMEGPALKMLNLHVCGIRDTDHMCQMQQRLFSLVEKAFPCLQELILAGEDLTMMWQEQNTKCFLKKFKILQILDEFKDDFFYGRQTIFRYIGDVKYMWKENFKLDLILPNFEDITVRGCDSFISLMPPSVSFQNLTSLTIYRCHNLEHIVTFSMAKSLVKLIKMSISHSKKITEVVGNQGVIAEGKIIFSNLKSLSLESLPSLASFCSWNFTLEFQSLEKLEVLRCPNMKIFSQGNLTMQRLQDVCVDKKSVQLCPDIDLNTTLQKFYEDIDLNTTLQKFYEKKKCQISIEDEGDSSSHHMQ